MYSRIAGRGPCGTISSPAASFLRHAFQFPFITAGAVQGTPACEGERCSDESCEVPTYRLAVDVHEEARDAGNVWVITANVPGFKKDEITLEVKDNVLTIEAKRTQSAESTDAKATVYRRERRTANLIRQVRLPENAAGDGITAALAEGVLTVTIPQVPESKPRKITLD